MTRVCLPIVVGLGGGWAPAVIWTRGGSKSSLARGS